MHYNSHIAIFSDRYGTASIWSLNFVLLFSTLYWVDVHIL